MRRLLNTLFVTTQGAYLNKEGQAVIVNIEKKAVLRIPIHNLGAIVCFGQVSISPHLMHFCAQNNVSINYLNQYGRFLAKIQGPISGNVLLRKAHYRLSESQDKHHSIVRSFLTGKLINSRTVLRRFLRDHEVIDKVEFATNHLRISAQRLLDHESVDTLRGIEGDSAREYFSVFNHLITNKRFTFSGRNKRPPLDPVNAMLSFTYTLLVNDITAALETVGLDPQVGFLHKDRPGRPSLALDLMEEFRAFFADRLILSLINLKQVKPKDFTTHENGSVSMSDDARKTLLTAYQKRKKDELIHPFINEKCPIGLLFFIQAQLLARHIRGELDAYPPFIWE